jgi:hypothetical protein
MIQFTRSGAIRAIAAAETKGSASDSFLVETANPVVEPETEPAPAWFVAA